MNNTQKMLASFIEDTDFAITFELMKKLGCTIITVQDVRDIEDVQCIYVVGAKETVMYKFYKYKMFDRAVMPYGTNPSVCKVDVCELLAKLCASEYLTITIHT